MIVFAAAVACLVSVYLFMIAPNPGKKTPEKYRGDYAHRGLWDADKPENSLPAFRAAKQAGFGIETDIRMTRDGELVLLHDESTGRMCGKDRKVQECTLKEIRSFRLGDSGEQIPTFDEFLEAVGEDLPLVVEIKHDVRRDEICRKVMERLGGRKGPWCVESFDPLIVRWFRKNEKNVFRGQLAYGLNIPGRYPRNMQNFFLSGMIANVLGRPDFVAYDVKCERSLPFRLMARLFRPTLAAWTVQDERDMDRGKWDIRIFEGFIPEKRVPRP